MHSKSSSSFFARKKLTNLFEHNIALTKQLCTLVKQYYYCSGCRKYYCFKWILSIFRVIQWREIANVLWKHVFVCHVYFWNTNSIRLSIHYAGHNIQNSMWWYIHIKMNRHQMQILTLLRNCCILLHQFEPFKILANVPM